MNGFAPEWPKDDGIPPNGDSSHSEVNPQIKVPDNEGCTPIHGGSKKTVPKSD